MPSTDALVNRARNARWCAEHRNCRQQRPWLAGMPPYGEHLPGGAMTIAFDPQPRWPMQLRNARGLHGALTTLRGGPHERYPAWSLRPWLGGWAVYVADTGEARVWAGNTLNGALWDRPTAFQFGPLVKLRAPAVPKRGGSLVRIDAITPIVTRSMGGLNPCTCPTVDTLRGALSGELLYRLSPTHRDEAPGEDAWTQWVRPRVQVELVERHTEPARTPLGGKFGVVEGWQGHVVLRVNAVAYWLLLATERATGFGGRVAFGFGRIRVTPYQEV